MERLALKASSSGTSTSCHVIKLDIRTDQECALASKDVLGDITCLFQLSNTNKSSSMYGDPSWTYWQAKKSSAQRRERTNDATSNFHGQARNTASPGQFLQQPAGMKSMLNTNYLQDFEYLGENVFRCYLPEISVLGREVAPVMDLLVYSTEAECVVEMIACKFEAPDASGGKVERFSANMKNHLQWKCGEDGELLLCTNLNIGVSIEVHNLPFTMLPLSAVETPGNAVLQAIVDRMVPVFMQQLLDDYYNWVEERPHDQTVSLFHQQI